MPAGTPDTANSTLASKSPFFATVIIKSADCGGVKDCDGGTDDISKSGSIALSTISATVIVLVTPPPSPVIVMICVPSGVFSDV